MGESKIEWTDYTFNPWIGCHKVSTGCKNYYAEVLNKRMGWCEWGETYHRTSETNWKKVRKWNRDTPGARVFCASLADVFDKHVPLEWRWDLWELVRETPNLIWLILTKHPNIALNWMPADLGENVWLGASIEDGENLFRAYQLTHASGKRTKDYKKFLSLEPLLSPIPLLKYELDRIDWVIVGGESGADARRMDTEWAIDILDACRIHNVPFFFKQLGSWWMKKFAPRDWRKTDFKGGKMHHVPAQLRVREFPHVETEEKE